MLRLRSSHINSNLDVKMVRPLRRSAIPILVLALSCCALAYSHTAYSGPTPAAQKNSPFAGAFDVKKFGAKGDGKALDTPAVNKAIEAAAA